MLGRRTDLSHSYTSKAPGPREFGRSIERSISTKTVIPHDTLMSGDGHSTWRNPLPNQERRHAHGQRQFPSRTSSCSCNSLVKSSASGAMDPTNSESDQTSHQREHASPTSGTGPACASSSPRGSLRTECVHSVPLPG